MLLELGQDLLGHLLLQVPLSDEVTSKRVGTTENAYLLPSPGIEGHGDLIEKRNVKISREIEQTLET
jgi:hypothetical protein